jgi:AraC-like DNA-binding protein
MVFINTQELHRTTSTEFCNREIFLLYLSRDMLPANDELLPFSSSPFLMGSPVLSLNMQQQQWAEQLLHGIWLEYQRQEPGYLASIQSLLTQLIVFSVRCNILRSQLSEQKEKSLHPKIADVVQWINRQFSEHLTLATLSSRFYISPSYLSRLFREMTGFSFVEYLAAVRIKEAQKLLRETRWKVSHISEMVGFESEKHFYKTFRKITGQSPLVYRKLERGGVMITAENIPADHTPMQSFTQ